MWRNLSERSGSLTAADSPGTELTDPMTWAGAKPRQYAQFVRPEVITLAEMHEVARDIDA